MASFSRRIQQYCSYGGTAGRDEFFWGNFCRFIFLGIPYLLIGTIYFTGLGFEPDTPQGSLALSIWLIPYLLLFNFPLAMRRWRDLNGKLHARWLMVYFIYCLTPELSDLTDNQYLKLIGYLFTILMLYPGLVLTFARGEKSMYFCRNEPSISRKRME